jgi:ell wall binding domain 2 (CWB2)
VPPKERPINADVPAPQAGAEPGKRPRSARPPTPARRRRKPVPGALKAIAALFVLAVAFIVAAILGGGSGESPRSTAPAPVETSAAQGETSATQTAEQLGFPTFATANTTRVGGADPTANAAGVALAAFPSAQPSQRPAAVTLIDGEDWRGAIAAAALMAAPIGAPVLVSAPDAVPEATSQALAALDPQGSGDTGGAQAFAIGPADTPSGLTTKSVGGGTAGAAAIEALRERLTGRPPDHVVVASAEQPAFAMPAAAWAARSGDPVLFADRERLPAATAAALRRHPHTPVYVLGPSSAISSDVVRRIAAIVGRVRRVSGEDAVENAIALARYADGTFGWNVNDPGHGFVVARSDAPLDAAAAAALSASGTWGPLLLTDSADTLPAALRGYLLDVKPGYTTDPTRAFYNHVWVIGDQEAIDVSQQAEIDELAALAKIGGEG